MENKAQMALAPRWEYVADTVMGGISLGTISHTDIEGRSAVRLKGAVSLENNGGFVQMAFNLHPDGSAIDASGWSGVAMNIIGNNETYDLPLRTNQLSRPWQSFRAPFTAPVCWTTLHLPFADFQAHKTDAQFDARALRRIGILTVGRAFDADAAVSDIWFYK